MVLETAIFRPQDSAQHDVQLFAQRVQHAVDGVDGVLVGQRPVVGAQLEREGNALFARCDAGAAIDVKQLNLPQQLSGGQCQRGAIARALALQPDILCFDEPTSALDPELTGEVLKVIRELADQNTTMIIVTHEMAFARDVADHVIFMDDGRIVEQGDPRQVFENPSEERTKQFLSRFHEG